MEISNIDAAMDLSGAVMPKTYPTIQEAHAAQGRARQEEIEARRLLREHRIEVGLGDMRSVVEIAKERGLLVPLGGVALTGPEAESAQAENLKIDSKDDRSKKPYFAQ